MVAQAEQGQGVREQEESEASPHQQGQFKLTSH